MINSIVNKNSIKDLDNVFVEFLIDGLKWFDNNEDNYMHPNDKHRMYKLIHLLEEYRNGYNETYILSKGNVEEWNKLKTKQYNEMFRLMKRLLPKLYI